MWCQLYVGIVSVILMCKSISAAECDAGDEEERAKAYMHILNERCAQRANRVALASWAYSSNITECNLQASVI